MNSGKGNFETDGRNEKAPGTEGIVGCADGCVKAAAPKAAATQEKYNDRYIITVDSNGSGDSKAIQDAIDASKPGTIINVGPGTYHGSLVIDIPGISLIGSENVTVTSSDGHTVLVRANDCTIKNMNLIYEGEDPMFFVVNMVRGMLLEGCELIGGKATYTILVGEYARPLIRNNRIHHGKRGIKIANNGAGARIEDNIIYMHEVEGINLGVDAAASMKGNKIFKCGVGVSFGMASRGTLEDNEIRENDIGIDLWEIADPVIRDNAIHADDCGILVCNQGHGVIENNHLFNNEAGIVVESDAAPIVQKNSIRGCRTGIKVKSGIFVENHIHDHRPSLIKMLEHVPF